MEKYTARASVHTIVEYALMGGDLLPAASAERLLEGVRGHRSLQSMEQEGVINELPVRCNAESEHVTLTVYGRIDRLHGLRAVEEIKTILFDAPEDADPLHWAQAECYAHMVCLQEDIPHIDVCITYLNLTDGDLTRYTRTRTKAQLQEAFDRYVSPYLAHLERQHAHRTALRQEMQTMTFPYGHYRTGQRELAAEVFRTIRDKKMLLAQAPTGTGKTMAALFPALKGIGEGITERIFYLTARSTQRQAAFDALRQLHTQQLRAVAIHARESACAQEKPICRTGLCTRQIGYYDRLPDALAAARQRGGLFDRDAVRALAEEFHLCPFELSLDLSLECDVILCDYNYLFDPRVRLQRYASGGRQGQVLLIDEAHNLPDRARSMYSAALTAKTLDAARKSIAKPYRKQPLYHSLRRLIKLMGELAEQGEIPRAQRELPEELVYACEDALEAVKTAEFGILSTETASQLTLDLSGFLYHAAHRDDNSYLLLDGGKSTRVLTLFCADASAKTAAVLKRSRAAILFSATLTPMDFYRTLTGAAEDAGCVYLLSPFPQENLCVMHLPVSTRYAAREQTLPRVAAAVASLVLSREKGNFIAFFPSYAYLEKARELIEMQLGEEAELLVQTQNMDENDRADFLARFSPEPAGRLLGLCVLGGVFSEGIDLTADRLCGAAVIGVGLPQVGVERNTLKSRYEEVYGEGRGFDYAYVYPGMGKVLQASGRIIRSETDRGVLLLIDDRYGAESYRALLPQTWQVQRVYSAQEIERLAARFWRS